MRRCHRRDHPGYEKRHHCSGVYPGGCWGPHPQDALLEGQLAEARRAQEVAEEKFHRLMNSSFEGARWLVESEVWHREQFKLLSLL
jgi:hypothetical protein